MQRQSRLPSSMMMIRVIVFLFHELRFSALSRAGFGRQAIVKIPLPTDGKDPGPSNQATDHDGLIGAAPGSDRDFLPEIREPAGKMLVCRPPSAAGDRVA